MRNSVFDPRASSVARVFFVFVLWLASLPVIAAIDAHALGARYDANQANITFKVHSSRATRIEVWIYKTASGAQPVVSYVMTKNASTGIWSKTASVATLKNSYGLTGTVYYGYRAWGPNWPWVNGWTRGSSLGFASDVDAQGNRFNPNKLLIDPYARELSHDPQTPSCLDGTIYASGAAHRTKDSGPCAPKGIVLAPSTTSIGTKPTRALKDDIVYEVHVRGLTKNDTSVPAAKRGTYAGAALKAAYLAGLGVTAVEFLPVQETQNDANDVDPGSTAGDNYWGYMTLNYFAPDRRYSSDKTAGGPTREWKAMVKAFHDVGIKVYVDVVYNHTGEGGPWGGSDGLTVYNVLSWRGLDNPQYYSLTSDLQYPWDNTGVGGNYNTRNAVAQNLIVDSLAYWRDALGVDGFRYDLASVLGNSCQHGCFHFDKMDGGNALNRIVAELPPRPAGGGSGVDHIAEPWAIWGNSYQVGGFPSGWAEWNGKFRDDVRKKQNQLGVETVTMGTLASRVAGIRPLRRRRAQALALDQFHRRARRLHPRRSLRLRHETEQPTLALRTLRRRRRQQPQLEPGRRRQYAAARGAHRARPDPAQRRRADVHRRRRNPAYPVRQQQPLQPRLGRELAAVDLRCLRHRLPQLHPAPDRLPQGASRVAPGEFLYGQRRQRQCHGAAALVQTRWRAGRCGLLQQQLEPCPGLAHRRQRVRRSGERDLPRLQRLVWRREFRAAVAGQRTQLVSRGRYRDLERRPEHRRRAGQRSLHRRRGHELRPAGTFAAAVDREIGALTRKERRLS